MSTRQTIEQYFERLEQRGEWHDLLADDMDFTSFTSPIKHVEGKTAFLESTKRFYSGIAKVEVRTILVDGDRACALTRYEIRPPNGAAFQSDVAEVFTVSAGKITSLEIYFDSAPFPK